MSRRAAIIGAAITCAIIAAFNVSGVCYLKPGFLSHQELYKAAVLRQENRMSGFPQDADSRDAYAGEYVVAHPECCTIAKSDALGSSVLADLFGFKVFLVRVAYELSKAQIEYAPEDGTYYESYVEVSPCGRSIHTFGQRLKELPKVSSSGG